MTAEEKRIALEMYLAGESSISIGRKLHYCAATITNSLPPEIKRRGRRTTDIIYPGIAKWVAKKGITLEKFSEMVGVGSASHLSAILHGRYNTSKATIDKILATTGLTYEEAFSLAKDDVSG